MSTHMTRVVQWNLRLDLFYIHIDFPERNPSDILVGLVAISLSRLRRELLTSRPNGMKNLFVIDTFCC
jgi:hypothetical protein